MLISKNFGNVIKVKIGETLARVVVIKMER